MDLTAVTDTPPPPESAIDWDAEEESAAAQRGPSRLSRSQQRRWWIIGTLGVLIMVGMAVWWGLAASMGRVMWNYTGHEVVSDTQVDVRLDLRRDPSQEVVCRMEAQDEFHAVVGRTDVTIGPAPSSPSRHVVSIRTATPAITGYVEQCWYADEGPRDRR